MDSNPVSLCKHLQTLRIVTAPISLRGGYNHQDFLKAVLSTIKSPLRINVIVTYGERYFSTGCDRQWLDHTAPALGRGECVRCTRQQLERFNALGEAYKARNFNLVLCVELRGSKVESATRILEQDMKPRKVGELSYPLPESSIVSMIPRV